MFELLLAGLARMIVIASVHAQIPRSSCMLFDGIEYFYRLILNAYQNACFAFTLGTCRVFSASFTLSPDLNRYLTVFYADW